ncbi:MAG: class I tRNA ligase family protein [Candidatus Pacebacteria bacterium]|nr:class I tRNA ligase family protein [Candidatus Paceibacterota bacterium]
MDLNFPKLEKEILEFWKNDGTFEKSIMRRKNAPNFVFYEGPPTANGKPGIHHVLSRVFKDIICRYKTMQGFRVMRKAGWDTHGLPVELEIEKKLGLKSKKDIEKFGIAEFNKLCKESVWNYKKDWEDLTERIAFWLDLKNPYITYETNYIETIWWIIKEIWKKGLVYKGYKVVPYCPRCGTSLSSHEVAQGYERIKEPAIYIKFRITDAKFGNSYLLVWTTTPWTLPGNVAVAVNPEITYVMARVNNEKLILAKERLSVLGDKYETIREFKGKELLNLGYEPLYKFSKPDKKSWFVIPGDFVSTEEGTGLVHIAPAFGEEDMEAGKENNLPVLLTVDEEGKLKPEIKNWAGLFVKEADPLIIGDLKKRNLLFKEEIYEHDYPFCWRCKSPLLYYAKQSWFINMQKVKKDLVSENKKINWVPSHLKEGRFGEWLEELKDWAFSRERYWGTPLPIWQCKKCGNSEVIGSKKELLEQKFSNNNYFILRHGESQTQIKKITACWPEKIPLYLTEKGKKEILSAAKTLKGKKIDLIFSSDVTRTKQTAEIVAEETGAKLIFDKRIREFDVGVFNGGKPIEVWNFLKSKDDLLKTKIPEGESLLDVQKRMTDFLNDLNGKYQNKNILIVSHELPLTVLENSLTGKSLKEILEQRQWEKEKRIRTGEFRKLEFKVLPHNNEGEFDFHRPYIDGVKFYCPKCSNGLMERTPEVIDCWLDSGSMPFAQYHYPFENKDVIDKKEQFPADYISEAIDQTRGWFYTLHAISNLLGKGLSYKNVISLGHVLDEKGEKMSKSKGNIVDPWYIVDKYGADATRWYFYTVNQPGDSKLFSEREVDLTLKKFILTLWNSFIFFETYAKNSKGKNQKSKNILDKWIVSKLNGLIGEVTKELDSYDVTGAPRAIETFVVEDLSQWHIRRSRKRFQKPETKKELAEASETLAFVLLTLSKIMAPFIPFLSEEINKKLGGEKSVHLDDWPKTEAKSINKNLEEKMEKVREIVALSLAERAKAGIKVRQPLNGLQITNSDFKKEKDLLELIKDEVNVKEITFGKLLKLDIKITSDLKEEGMVREIIRNIQEMRKKAGLKPENKILVRYSGDPDLGKILTREKNLILGEARVKDLILGEKEKEVFDAEREIKVDNKNLWLAIKKI